MIKNDITISPSEREVLRVVWAHPETTSQFIIQSLHEAFNWQAPTIKTLINRLLKKGILTADTRERQYRYTATISESEQLHIEMTEFLAHICDTKKGQVLSELLQQVTLTQKDIKTLEHILLQKEQSAPARISCNCLPGQCTCHSH